MPPAVSHPARFHDRILEAINERLEGGWLVLDPYAGTGRIHELDHVETVGVELEPEWAGLHQRTIQGDAGHLPFAPATFDAIATSPAYGNRFADRSVRPAARTWSYAHSLGRLLSPGSGAALHWGQAYRDLHAAHCQEFARVLKPGGRFVLNMKDSVKAWRHQPLVDWWCTTLAAAGFVVVVPRFEVATPSLRCGSNSSVRYTEEIVVLELCGSGRRAGAS